MTRPKLVNAVGGGSLGRELDLQLLYETIEGEEVRYDPEYWPGLYLRFNSESPAILVFRTGKYNIAGADSIQELFETNEEFLSHIYDLEAEGIDSCFEIRNLVFLDQYKNELNLDQVVIGLGLENAEYEPEQFPGILFRPPEVIGTFLIFRNGKVILTGANSSNEAIDAFDSLFELLDRLFN